MRLPPLLLILRKKVEGPNVFSFSFEVTIIQMYTVEKTHPVYFFYDSCYANQNACPVRRMSRLASELNLTLGACRSLVQSLI